MEEGRAEPAFHVVPPVPVPAHLLAHPFQFHGRRGKWVGGEDQDEAVFGVLETDIQKRVKPLNR